MKKSNFHLFIDYFLVFMLIAISGLNYFYLVKGFITFTFILNILVLTFRRVKIDFKEITLIFILVFLEIFQGIVFKKLEVVAVFGLFMRLASGYLTIKIVGKDFFKTYVNLIVFFALVSFPFYLLTFSYSNTKFMIDNFASLFPPLIDLKTDQMQIHPNVILYTFSFGSIYETIRNSGPFYEPGMFSIFLNIALIFNIIINKVIFSRKNIILIVAILTTLSTAGYLGLFVVIMGSFFHFKSFQSVLVLIIFIIAGTYFYNNLPFLKNKIETSIERKDETTSRFGSLYADLVYIRKSPIIGNGRFLFERIGISIWDVQSRHRNNGVSKLMVNYGIPFAIYFFYLVYSSFKKTITANNSRFNPFIALLLILILGFSQVLFQYAFFLSFPFLFLSLKNYKYIRAKQIT